MSSRDCLAHAKSQTRKRLTIVHALANGLEHFQVDESGAAVIAVILILVVTHHAFSSLGCSVREGRLACDTGYNRARVE